MSDLSSSEGSGRGVAGPGVEDDRVGPAARARPARPLPDDTPLEEPLTSIFARAAQRDPDGAFLESRDLEGESFTFGSFRETARAVARSLAAAGVAPGDRVALLAENRPRWCVAHAAVLEAAAVVVPLDAQLGAESVAGMLSDCGASALFLGAETAERLPELRELSWTGEAFGLEELAGCVPWSELVAGAGEASDPAPELRGGDATAAILYTSGTTGRPKGVVLTHRNLQAELAGIATGLELRRGDTLLLFLPLQHVLSQVGSFLIGGAAGLRLVHARVQRGEDLLAAVREEGVTILLAVPLLYHLIHERVRNGVKAKPLPVRVLFELTLRLNAFLRGRLGLDAGRVFFRQVHEIFGSDLRLLLSGGSPLNDDVQRDFWRMGFDLGQAYGLTETSGAAALSPADDVVLGTVGRPLPGVEVRIDRPDEDGTGEILLRGPIVTPGYLDRPSDTAELLKDGWLHAGDLGRLHPSGHLVVSGRSKDVIVLGSGKNVYPEELEAHYARSPIISELCVMGRSRSAGPDRTEKLHAVVVPDWRRLQQEGGATARERVRFELEELSFALPPWQRVLSFELRREPLPRTATRKLQRHLVQAGQETGEGAPAPPPDEPEVARRLESEEGRLVVELVRRRAGAESEVRGASALELDLGLDSLNRMELLLSVEAATGITIEDDEAERVATVDDLVRLVLEKGGETGEPAGGSSWADVVAAAGPSDLPPGMRKPRSALSNALLQLMVGAARLLAAIVFRFRVRGREHLPESGAFLACPNHVSWLDGFFVALALPPSVRRRGFVLGEAAYLEGPVVSRLARFAGVLPTDPNRHLRRALRAGAAGLKQGRVLVLFPEGIRSADGTLQELKQGAAILSAELDVPIVPVLVEGAHEAWPRGRRLPRPARCGVTFGEPLRPSEITEGEASGADEGSRAEARHERLTAALRDALLALGAPAPRD